MTKPVKTMLVKAPDGFGYHLNQQKPSIYVSGRPYVVQNSTQVQTASARNALIILGETDMTDEEFFEAYQKDEKAAIEEAILDNDNADKAAATEAVKAAKEAKAEAARIAKEEKARLKEEAATKKAAEAAHKAELEAKEATKNTGGND